MELILEGWRNYQKQIMSEIFVGTSTGLALRGGERGEQLTPGAEKLIKAHDLGLEDYVAMLKSVASDPGFRELALAGTDDRGGVEDEAVTITTGTPIQAQKLTPTQKEIEVKKSLGDQMTNKYGATAAALSSDGIMMPAEKGPVALLTHENVSILDGHHRWSQIMMTNPEGIVAVMNLGGAAVPNAEIALKATQLAIAGLAGNVLTKGVTNNLLKLPANTMRTIVIKGAGGIGPITDEVLKLLVGAGKISKPDRKEAAEYYVKNLGIIQGKPAGKFSREKGMPQADDSGVAQTKVNKALAAGEINFYKPAPGDVKK